MPWLGLVEQEAKDIIGRTCVSRIFPFPPYPNYLGASMGQLESNEESQGPRKGT